MTRALWNERYRMLLTEKEPGDRPSPALEDLSATLPRRGRALDVAGGLGANARFLASLGLETTLVDTSDVAVQWVRDRGGVEAITVDLETEPVPLGPWALIICLNYLQRDLFGSLRRSLEPGGFLLFVQPTITNLERHVRPSKRFLLEPGEGRKLVCDRSMKFMLHQEQWFDDTGRHECRVLARKHCSGPAEG